MMSKTVVTCALTGVLTDPAQHHVPVTPEQMAGEARAAFDAGASVMHVHFRQQTPGMGHLPSWEPAVAAEIAQAIREACPGVVFNQSTGVVGPDIAGPLACMRAIRPEIAACNAGSLNYLKVRSDGSWAWRPMLFDNPVEKVKAFLDVMDETGALPEFECFDTGIVRTVEMYARTGLYRGHLDYNFVMGVESGMPADPELLPILTRLLPRGATWQVTAIGRSNVWPLHRRTAELGGNLRTGLEDTFYLPDGSKASGNGALIEAIVRCARDSGREIASPAEAREILGITAAPRHEPAPGP
jgi:3-keto-5-aminohexanoate cleavage enzyme